METEWIETDDGLVELCEHLREQDFIAVDTEFHRERTYFAQLALVQVASTERVACIDPLAGVDLAPLDAILLDGEILKVFHAARQDLEIFFDRTGEVPGPIFDSQVAASLLGLGDQLGYSVLVAKTVGVQLDKLHGRTDWMRRPLDANVIEYAADDVRHLRDVYRALDEKLDALGRRSWLDEEQLDLTRLETYRPADDRAWEKLKGAGRLKGVECAVASSLAAWRLSEARRRDWPRRRIVSDEAIYDLARQRPKNVGGLSRLRSLDAQVAKRDGKRIVDEVQAAAGGDPAGWPAPLAGSRPAPHDSALVDALSSVLRHLAQVAGISPRMLASRDDLERLASGERGVGLLEGWRAELAGDVVAEFLAGGLVMDVHEGELRLRSVTASAD